MNGPHAATVRRIAMPGSWVWFVGQAVRWLAEHFDQPIRIADLAAHVGVSVPTLNRHFRAVTAMSPLQYQKQLRLQRARVELLAAPGDVAAVGYAVGYDSPSQFAANIAACSAPRPARTPLASSPPAPPPTTPSPNDLQARCELHPPPAPARGVGNGTLPTPRCGQCAIAYTEAGPAPAAVAAAVTLRGGTGGG